jgi:hypothetical protein
VCAARPSIAKEPSKEPHKGKDNSGSGSSSSSTCNASNTSVIPNASPPPTTTTSTHSKISSAKDKKKRSLDAAGNERSGRLSVQERNNKMNQQTVAQKRNGTGKQAAVLGWGRTPLKAVDNDDDHNIGSSTSNNVHGVCPRSGVGTVKPSKPVPMNENGNTSTRDSDESCDESNSSSSSSNEESSDNDSDGDGCSDSDSDSGSESESV